MKRPTDKEARALARVQAADLEESRRGMLWGLLPVADKARALQRAGLDTRRAREALGTFTPAERSRINTAVGCFILRMQIIEQIMGVSEVSTLAPTRFH